MLWMSVYTETGGRLWMICCIETGGQPQMSCCRSTGIQKLVDVHGHMLKSPFRNWGTSTDNILYIYVHIETGVPPRSHVVRPY